MAISVDQIHSHNVFSASLGTLPYPLLSDWHKTTVKDYGVFDEENEIAIRSCFLIDKQGQIAYQNTNFSASNPEDYKRLLEACENLSEK
ncbi:hypothetical protein B0X71_19120 (plasmid) [Planococcus lenghuensis]|uniref:Alkyl hydroperoxide reductase subunit C/ Thiol specific antioxidant domain-containing protein n=1 Tax=Planococcus lenghuensis TaxID=2213202 RepID=A0A1Q2L4E5_9BACL|nr:hypothetical protein B0X71_19120 [Planococcus lenghuensis]